MHTPFLHMFIHMCGRSKSRPRNVHLKLFFIQASFPSLRWFFYTGVPDGECNYEVCCNCEWRFYMLWRGRWRVTLSFLREGKANKRIHPEAKKCSRSHEWEFCCPMGLGINQKLIKRVILREIFSSLVEDHDLLATYHREAPGFPRGDTDSLWEVGKGFVRRM